MLSFCVFSPIHKMMTRGITTIAQSIQCIVSLSSLCKTVTNLTILPNANRRMAEMPVNIERFRFMATNGSVSGGQADFPFEA